MSLMRGALLIVIVTAGVAAADPAPKPVDIKDYKDKIVILKDADGGIYAVAPVKGNEHVFYAIPNSKVLYEQLLPGPKGYQGDVAWQISFNLPRGKFPFMGELLRKDDGSYERACVDEKAGLTEVTGDKAKEIIEKWKFVTPAIAWTPVMLARDDRGVYYYVDKLLPAYGGGGDRVWVGKKGGLKQQTLSDVTHDSGGSVYSTKSGDLRLVVNGEAADQKSAVWIRGEKKTELKFLDWYMNQALITRDLGIYKVQGLICGNL